MTEEKPYLFHDRFIDLPELIHKTSLKKTFIYELIKQGELRPLKLGRKTVFLESEVITWMNKKIQLRTGGAK